MTDRDDHNSPPVSGMCAGHDPDAHADTGWPQTTEEEGEQPPTGTADALEEEAPVRQAIDDDISTTAFGGQREDDRGRDAPEFQEPADSDD
ncbi:hypothetical protein [Streptomyces sp. NPDC006334]|uniref:hypothetical protein n=1 Tax=Streptomyces sp. NPDC006334 TaxID=3156754 RepID=UPI0033AC51F6